MKKRGVSQVVVTVILVALALLLIGFVWGAVQGILNDKTEGLVYPGFVELEITNVYFTEDNATIAVKRKGDKGDLSNLDFVFREDDGEQIERIKGGLKILETKSFEVPMNLVCPNIVEVYPVVGENLLVNSGSSYDLQCYDLDGDGVNSSGTKCCGPQDPDDGDNLITRFHRAYPDNDGDGVGAPGESPSLPPGSIDNGDGSHDIPGGDDIPDGFSDDDGEGGDCDDGNPEVGSCFGDTPYCVDKKCVGCRSEAECDDGNSCINGLCVSEWSALYDMGNPGDYDNLIGMVLTSGKNVFLTGYRAVSTTRSRFHLTGPHLFGYDGNGQIGFMENYPSLFSPKALYSDDKDNIYLVSTYSGGCFVYKYNNQMEKVLEFPFPCESYRDLVYALSLDDEENFYLGGSLRSDHESCGYRCSRTLHNSLLRKYDSSGLFVWEKEYNLGHDDWIKKSYLDKDRNILYLLVQASDVGLGYEESFIVKVDLQTQEIIDQFATEISSVMDMEVDSSNNVYLMSRDRLYKYSFENVKSWEQDILREAKDVYIHEGNELVYVAGAVRDHDGPNSQFDDYYVSIFNFDGTKVWERQYEGCDEDAAMKVVADDYGGVYVSGVSDLCEANQESVLTIKYLPEF
jgi:hypothetical protein